MPRRKRSIRRPRGSGGLSFKSKQNCWVGYVTIGGKRKYFYGPIGDDSPAARIGVEERMRPYAIHRPTDATMTVADAVNDYLKHHADLAPATLENYGYAAKHILGSPGRKPPDPIARIALIDLEPADLRAFYARINTGPKMRQRVHVFLHAILREAERMNLILRNPAARLPRPKAERKERAIWRPDDMLRFLKAAQGHRLFALFLLSLTTTMGNAELFGLRWDDVDFAHRTLRVRRNLVTVGGKVYIKDPKTKQRERAIALPTITVNALRERKKIAMAEGHTVSLYVFTSRDGQPLRGDNFRNRIWYPLLEAAGVPRITPYAMRHIAKALMDLIGIPLERQSARMGHSDVGTTVNVYGHVYDRSGRVIADELDAFFDERLKHA